MTSRPVVVVLAAGSGSRFSGPSHKLGQRLGGSSVLGQVLRHALATQLPVIVVTTQALAGEAQQSLAARDIVTVPSVGTASDVPLGMGYSIAAGVSARPNASGWLILPADMPLVLPSSLLAVAQALEQHPIAYAQHQGRRGHPVGFSAELYSELSVLSGDAGARRLLARYPAHAVELDDPGVLVDIDTEADLLLARASQGEAPLAARGG
jgi:molybdenum cofactor cytidylyltransferase